MKLYIAQNNMFLVQISLTYTICELLIHTYTIVTNWLPPSTFVLLQDQSKWPQLINESSPLH